MAVDPQTERELRKRFAEKPLTIDSLREADEAYEQALCYGEKHEKRKKKIAFVTGIIVSFVVGYILDWIAVAIGLLPQELLLSNIAKRIWENLF